MDCRDKNAGSVARRALIAGALLLIVGGCEQKPVPGDADRKAAPGTSGATSMPDQTKQGNPSPAALKTDENLKLAAKVKAALLTDPAFKYATIDINASDGAVELFGTVDDNAVRLKASQIASNVPGVKAVKNNLVIVKGS